MKKILVLGALSLFGLSNAGAMEGAAALRAPRQVTIDNSNVIELKLPIGDRMNVSISTLGRMYMEAALQKIDNDEVNGIEILEFQPTGNCIVDDDQARQLKRTIMRNRLFLRSFKVSMYYDGRGLTDQGRIKVLEALSLCPNLENCCVRVPDSLSSVEENLQGVVGDRNKIAELKKSLRQTQVELQQKQEELRRSIAQAKAQMLENNQNTTESTSK